MIERVLSFYERVITPDFVRVVLGSAGLVEREGIFQSSIELWLMLFKRLRRGTLAEALEELRTGASGRLLARAGGSIRGRTGRISGHTGGISQARERLSIEVVNAACDALSGEILLSTKGSGELSKRVYIIDGSTIRTSHTRRNLREFPQYRNQHGTAHFPLVRICVATHALSGVVLRPAYGPYNGKNAVGELSLAPEVLSHLPPDSIVIGDRYFGCVRFALDAHEYGHSVICRVKEINCKRHVDQTPRGECEVAWISQKKESISGRFVWETIKIPGEKPYRLVLFTTTKLERSELLKLYALRWNVELDLRDIKSTLEMDSIECRTPKMFEKELLLGIAAYNLVRHALVQMGNAFKIPYRRFSFTRFLVRLQALEGTILDESMPEERKNLTLSRAMTDYKSLLLPVRKRRRPNEPRKVWPKGTLHTMRGSRELERKKLSK
jgi:hypothetical protein